MADRITTEHRSWNMSRIGARNTQPELLVRSILHRMGFRFRLHRKDLPGKPDIVLPKHRAVVFVHGCFWHRHKGCKYTTTPSTRREWWLAKFEKTVQRDQRNKRALSRLGWRVIVVWQCEINDPSRVAKRLKRFLTRQMH